MRAIWRRSLQLAAALAVLSMGGCFPPYAPVPEDDLAGVRFDYLQVEGHALRYAEAGAPELPMVLMIHGTPGSWQGFASFLEDPVLARHAHLVAPDRPGFGGSRAGDWLPGLREQSRLLMAFAKLNHSGCPILLVGHSLGGTIAYRMAIDAPGEVAGVVAIGAGIDPEAASARWYNHLASLPLVNGLVPDGLRRANREIMPLGQELQAMGTQLGALADKVTVIHGTRDRLVAFANVAYVRREIPAAHIVAVPGAGHFVIWEQPGLITREILDRLGVPDQCRASSDASVEPHARDAASCGAQLGDNRWPTPCNLELSMRSKCGSSFPNKPTCP